MIDIEIIRERTKKARLENGYYQDVCRTILDGMLSEKIEEAAAEGRVFCAVKFETLFLPLRAKEYDEIREAILSEVLDEAKKNGYFVMSSLGAVHIWWDEKNVFESFLRSDYCKSWRRSRGLCIASVGTRYLK